MLMEKAGSDGEDGLLSLLTRLPVKHSWKGNDYDS